MMADTSVVQTSFGSFDTAPIPGQTIAFVLSAAPRTTVCTGTTNSAGVAKCRSGTLSILTVLASSSYSASYGGGAFYLPSATTARIILL